MNTAAEHWSLVATVGVVAIVAVAAFARRVGVAAPLILVLVGIGLSWVPGMPRLEVDPELILTVVLPPILYASALRMPSMGFRRDREAIGTLSFVLVVATTVAVGYLANAVLPGLGLAAAFALGAALGPTDAVAATGIGARLGLSSRLLVILEGEGLVNDASSLGLVLGWSGMRGAITVAAAQSLPADLPLRPQVLLAAFSAALLTLLVPGLSLPAVIRILKVPGDDRDADRAQLRALLGTLGSAANETLDAAADDDRYPPSMVDQVREDLGTRHGKRPEAAQDIDPVQWREDYGRLMLSALGAERQALLAAQRVGTYSTRDRPRTGPARPRGSPAAADHPSRRLSTAPPAPTRHPTPPGGNACRARR